MALDVTEDWPIDTLEQRVASAFSEEVEIDCVLVEERGVAAKRHNQHVVAVQRDGPDYGIKLAPRSQEDLRLEALGYDLARIAEAPNACRAARIDPDPEFPGEFGRSGPLLIERMEGNIVPVRDLRDSQTKQKAKTSIQDNAVSFLSQFGEWFVLTALMGTEDRHGENLIWDLVDAKLLHVDFGQGFEECVPESHLRSQLRFAAMTRLSAQDVQPETDDFLGSALVSGIEAMDNKLRSKKDAVLQQLEEAELDEAYIEDAKAWIETPLEEKIELTRTLLP